jgi:hypothetical protein
LGLFDSLFKRSYPTRDWPAGDGRELCFDFDKNALCDVAIGERMERLRFLGPAKDAQMARQECLNYPSKGFYVHHDNGRIASYVIFYEDCRDNKYTPFAGKCIVGGREAAFSRETTEQQLVQLWGEPYWRDTDDDDEIVLYYERDNVEWQVELDPAGTLTVINVISPPMLASAEQRKAVGVTKPWPP